MIACNRAITWWDEEVKGGYKSKEKLTQDAHTVE